MDRKVTINRVRLRVPAAHGVSPEILAANIAQGLKSKVGGWGDQPISSVSAKTSARSSGLAETVVTAIDDSVKGHRS